MCAFLFSHVAMFAVCCAHSDYEAIGLWITSTSFGYAAAKLYARIDTENAPADEPAEHLPACSLCDTNPATMLYADDDRGFVHCDECGQGLNPNNSEPLVP
jgi:hypothetical protein